MAASIRPRRSALYVPGSNAQAIDKGRTVAADVLLFDLEDAVAPDQKSRARTQVLSALTAGGYGLREIAVRINGLDSPWGKDDLVAVSQSSADAILLPKVETPDLVREVAATLKRLGAPERLSIWCMIETPRGVLNAATIASASPRLGCLVLGTSDLAKDLHAHHVPGRLPFITAFGLCILAARANDLAVLDGVYLHLEDESGFAAQCQQGLELGFDGKTLIHPKTIAVANSIFGPTAVDIEEARRIIVTFEAAQSQGQGVAVLDGKLIENLHAENARRLLNLAEAIAQMKAAVS